MNALEKGNTGSKNRLFIWALPLQDTLGVFTADSANVAGLASEPHTIALVCTLQQLRTECGHDEPGTL